MGALAGILLRVGAKILAGFWLPLLAVIGGWLIEQATGAVSWGLFTVGQAGLGLVLETLMDITWPDTPNWGGLPSVALDIGRVSGLWTSVSLVVTSAVLRFVVRMSTLGRF